MPLDWLMEDADETTKQKVRAHSAKRSKTMKNNDNIVKLGHPFF